jgi:hypothetical protein
MIFVFSIPTPANTPATARQVTTLQLAAGKITHVGIQFPPGLAGLAHIAVSQGLHQLWPTNPEADFCTADETVEFEEDFDLTADTAYLVAYTYNLDDAYQHTITVRVTVMPPEVEASWWEEAKQLFGLAS